MFFSAILFAALQCFSNVEKAIDQVRSVYTKALTAVVAAPTVCNIACTITICAYRIILQAQEASAKAASTSSSLLIQSELPDALLLVTRLERSSQQARRFTNHYITAKVNSDIWATSTMQFTTAYYPPYELVFVRGLICMLQAFTKSVVLGRRLTTPGEKSLLCPSTSSSTENRVILYRRRRTFSSPLPMPENSVVLYQRHPRIQRLIEWRSKSFSCFFSVEELVTLASRYLDMAMTQTQLPSNAFRIVRPVQCGLWWWERDTLIHYKATSIRAVPISTQCSKPLVQLPRPTTSVIPIVAPSTSTPTRASEEHAAAGTPSVAETNVAPEEKSERSDTPTSSPSPLQPRAAASKPRKEPVPQTIPRSKTKKARKKSRKERPTETFSPVSSERPREYPSSSSTAQPAPATSPPPATPPSSAPVPNPVPSQTSATPQVQSRKRSRPNDSPSIYPRATKPLARKQPHDFETDTRLSKRTKVEAKPPSFVTVGFVFPYTTTEMDDERELKRRKVQPPSHESKFESPTVTPKVTRNAALRANARLQTRIERGRVKTPFPVEFLAPAIASKKKWTFTPDSVPRHLLYEIMADAIQCSRWQSWTGDTRKVSSSNRPLRKEGARRVTSGLKQGVLGKPESSRFKLRIDGLANRAILQSL